MSAAVPLRTPCPPGACICSHRQLLETPGADLRVLRLTRTEERRLVERLEQVSDLQDLQHVCQRMQAQLGIRIQLSPGHQEVRSARGIRIRIQEQPGLCRKSRKAITAAIRRNLDRRPQVLFQLLDAHDLLGAAHPPSPGS